MANMNTATAAGVQPSKLYRCPACGGKWYGRALTRDGKIINHVNRTTTGPAFNRHCSGSGQPAK